MRATIVIVLVLGMVWLHTPIYGYEYNYNSRCAGAYNHFMALRLHEGNELIKAELREHPGNLMAVYIADYEDCLAIILNGSKKEYEQSKDGAKKRMELLEKGDERNPWYRLCRAGMHLRWAVINLRFQENFKAAATFRKSFILLKENKKLFPSFAPNDVYLGIEEAAVGTIPGEYKWLASVAGLKGDVKNGFKKLDAFINRHTANDLLYNEAAIYYCYLQFYLLTKRDEAMTFINSNKFEEQDNLLNLFVKANLAINYRKADLALQTIKQAQSLPVYGDFPILDFEMGSALLLQSDPACIAYFQRFISHARGDFFIKDAYQSIALAYFLKGDMHNANAARKLILSKGNNVVDADKQALRFAKNEVWPNKVLLQTRLLIDGGYYIKAKDILSVYKPADFVTVAERLEYYFRMGRVYDELRDDAHAVTCYTATIDMGKERPEHFAARAALQLGFLYERKKKYAEAIRWYKLSMNMENTDFKNSIDQQAKSGINRLTISDSKK